MNLESVELFHMVYTVKDLQKRRVSSNSAIKKDSEIPHASGQKRVRTQNVHDNTELPRISPL